MKGLHKAVEDLVGLPRELLDGQMISATGPSEGPPAACVLDQGGEERRMVASVLPLPVKATSIMSLPEKATRIPCISIGVGPTIPRLSRCSVSQPGSFIF